MSTRKVQLLRRAAGNDKSRMVAITREEKALRAFLENAGGADWNAAEGEPGHVANRTHYEESGFVPLLAKRKIWVVAGGLGLFSVDVTITIGKKYTVIVDGTEYKCTAWKYDGDENFYAGLGNGNVSSYTDLGDDVPFCLYFYDGGRYAYFKAVDYGTYVVSIRGDDGVIMQDQSITIAPSEDDPEYFNGHVRLQGNKVPSVGDTLKVFFDGKSFECIAADDGYGGVVLGSLDEEYDENMPFTFYFWYEDWNDITGIDLYSKQEWAAYTIAIEQLATIVHKLDPKFLPISTQPDLILTFPHHGRPGQEELNEVQITGSVTDTFWKIFNAEMPDVRFVAVEGNATDTSGYRNVEILPLAAASVYGNTAMLFFDRTPYEQRFAITINDSGELSDVAFYDN